MLLLLHAARDKKTLLPVALFLSILAPTGGNISAITVAEVISTP
ncbi:hypothetical protein ACFL54_00625 [Planctomycetota bacterium]